MMENRNKLLQAVLRKKVREWHDELPETVIKDFEP